MYIVLSPDLCYLCYIATVVFAGIWCCCPLLLLLLLLLLYSFLFLSFNFSNNYIYRIGDQFIGPYGFSGSLPLSFANVLIVFVLIVENKLLVGWLKNKTLKVFHLPLSYATTQHQKLQMSPKLQFWKSWALAVTISMQLLTIFLIASFECPAAVITSCNASDRQIDTKTKSY